MVNYLLEMPATDSIIAEAAFTITAFEEPSGMIAAFYAKAVWEKSLRYGMVYKKPGLKGFSLRVYVLLFAVKCVLPGERTTKLNHIP